jgi:hypothetical protein
MGDLNRSKNGYTFDTNIGIKLCETPNLGNLLSCRLNFKDSEIHLNSQVVTETERNNYDIEIISKLLHKATGAKIIFGEITDDMQDDSEYLLTLCETLHPGDNQILAYTRATKTTLITCDKGLATAASICGVNVVNPSILPCDEIAKKVTKSKFHRIVKKTLAKPSQTKQKVKLFVLKPGQKIIWRSFN